MRIYVSLRVQAESLFLSLREVLALRQSIIQNLAFNFGDSIVKVFAFLNYGLPRVINHARNDISHCVIVRCTQVTTKQYHLAKGGFCAREQYLLLQKIHRLKKEFKQRK